MKIIEARSVPVYEVVCTECRSKIQYKSCETHFGFITCPVCGVSLWASTIMPVGDEPPKEDEGDDE